MEISSNMLLQILADPGNISSSDQEVLEQAINEYPYFQLARTLVAKAKHDQQAPDAYESLGAAAIYAPDRRHLRKVFYENVHIDWQPSENQPVENASGIVEATPELTSEEPIIEKPTSDVTETSEKAHLYSDELSEKSEVDTFEEASAEVETSEISETETPQAEESDTVHSDTESRGIANHDQEEEIVYRELEENLRKLRQAKEESRKEEEDKKKIADSTEVPDGASQADDSAQSPLLLDYLHGIEPVSSDLLGIHQQKQNELINRFVNSDTDAVGRLRPTLSQNDAETQDLSEQSSIYNGEVVTENLAEIMLKQGKKEKAIKIYQQLILKFPEKKAYFAERIDSLN